MQKLATCEGKKAEMRVQDREMESAELILEKIISGGYLRTSPGLIKAE